MPSIPHVSGTSFSHCPGIVPLHPLDPLEQIFGLPCVELRSGTPARLRLGQPVVQEDRMGPADILETSLTHVHVE